MSDTSLPVIFRFDTAANRAAFTPTPGVAEQLYLWTDSDSQPDTYYWDGAAWQQLNSAGAGGITELTGDVTAGPGTGSQAATIANDAVTTVKILDANVTPDKLSTAAKTKTIGIVIDGNGSVPATGIKVDIEVPVACTITAVRMFADQSGSAVVDIWKDTYANYPPTDADSITAAAPPTISSATKSEDTTLTGWTTSITAGNTLRFNLDSIATITRLTLQLTVVLA